MVNIDINAKGSISPARCRFRKTGHGETMTTTRQTGFRTALVTGGAKRIGAAIAADLAAHGFAVAIHVNKSMAAAEKLAGEIRASGNKAIVVGADLTDMLAVNGLLDLVRQQLGPVDLLINNASVFENDTAQAPDMELWDRHFAVHVKAPAILAARFAAQSEMADGLIVNIIDQRVWRLTPSFFSYTLSKAAMWTATQTMAQAFAPKVRVNAIGPGPALANERQTTKDFNHQVEGLLLKRGPTLDEMGETVRYLFQTPSITGQMIALDGGQHLAWQTPDVTGMAE